MAPVKKSPTGRSTVYLDSDLAYHGPDPAVRTALGAGRMRLVRQLLTESLVLALVGGLAGVGVASFTLDALLGLQPQGIPRLAEVHLDRTVLAFSSSANIHAVSGERNTVGAIAFTVMPCFPHSQPSALVMPSTADFEVQ